MPGTAESENSMDCSRQVKTRIAVLALALAITGVLPAVLHGADALPDAREVLRLVRASESDQNRDYAGRLRMSTEEGTLIVPFRLLMRGATITYQFANPPEALVLHLGENGSRLERVAGGGKGTPGHLDAHVHGTDLTYEDLALKFLYWNNAKVVGEDHLMMRHCWVVQAVPSSRGESQYDMVRLWVEKSGGLLKAECYSHGKLAKSFQVRNVQHSSRGGYVLKTLRVEQAGKDEPTYLELDPA